MLFVFLVHNLLDAQHDGFIQPMNERSEGTVCEVYQSFVRLLLFGGRFANIRESSAIGDVPYDSPLCQHMSSAFHAHPRGGWLPPFAPLMTSPQTPHEVTKNPLMTSSRCPPPCAPKKGINGIYSPLFCVYVSITSEAISDSAEFNL